MGFDVTCPNCGATVEGTDIERSDSSPPIPVARRQTAFDASITSLTDLGSTAYIAELPCGCSVLTVN